MVNTRSRRVLAMSDTNESVPPPQVGQAAGLVLPADVVSGVRTSADATLHASPQRPSPSLHVPFAHGADAPGHGAPTEIPTTPTPVIMTDQQLSVILQSLRMPPTSYTPPPEYGAYVLPNFANCTARFDGSEELFEKGRSHRRAPDAAVLPIPETSRASCVPTASKALSHRPRCVYCKQYGHAREDCNRLKEKASSVIKAEKSPERSQITCFCCGTPGVIRAKCIKCSKTAANSAFHTVSAIGSKPVDPRSRPLLEVLVYGARGRVLVDTGAKHCIASESLKAHLYKNNHKFVKVRIELKFADGTVKNLVVDTAQVEVTVLDIVVSTLFIVLPGATDSLLGMNFIKDSDSFRVACSTVGLPHDEGTVLKPEERRELSDVLERNQDVFEPGGAPTTLADHRIDRGDHAPDRVTFGTQYLKSCDICKQYKPTNLKPTVLLQTPTPQQRCEVLAMDLFGPLPAESQGEVKWSIGEQQDRRKAVKDQRRRPTARFKEGDLVWVEMHSHSNAEKGVTRKFAPRGEGPYKISTAVSPTTFEVIDKEGEVKGKYHASALSLYQGTSRSDAVTLRKRGRPAKSQPPSSGCDLEGEDIANGIQILKDDAIRHPRRTRRPPTRYRGREG
ncbi:unnamed protein product, partial [Brenthis ino]